MPNDRAAYREFTTEKLDKNNEFLRSITFSDDTTFQLSEKINKLHLTSRDQNTLTLQCSTLYMTHNDMWCGLLYDQLIRPHFYAEVTTISTSYLNMLEN
jgi:hypothetical protein